MEISKSWRDRSQLESMSARVVRATTAVSGQWHHRQRVNSPSSANVFHTRTCRLQQPQYSTRLVAVSMLHSVQVAWQEVEAMLKPILG